MHRQKASHITKTCHHHVLFVGDMALYNNLDFWPLYLGQRSNAGQRSFGTFDQVYLSFWPILNQVRSVRGEIWIFEYFSYFDRKWPLGDLWPLINPLTFVAIWPTILHTKLSWNRIQHVVVETFFSEITYSVISSRSKVKARSRSYHICGQGQWSFWLSLVNIHWHRAEL